MIEFTKSIPGELNYIGSTSIVMIETKGSRRLSIATVLTEAVDIDTACKYPVDFQANAHRIVKCCNGWDALKQQRDDLLKACDKFQEDIYQLSEGHCLLCGGKDYPVCEGKEGYEEVSAEDAEEWRLAHKEPCALIEFEAAIAKVKT